MLQPLDISVFGPPKEKFRLPLNFRTVKTTIEDRHDIFTLFELLCDSYHTSVNPQNAIDGFCRAEICSEYLQGVDMSITQSTDLTSGQISSATIADLPPTRYVTTMAESVASCNDTVDERISNETQLYQPFPRRSYELVSGGTVQDNGTMKVLTTSSASLTGYNAINALRDRYANQVT